MSLRNKARVCGLETVAPKQKRGGFILDPPACCQFHCDRRHIAGIAGVSVMCMTVEAVAWCEAVGFVRCVSG